MNHVRRKSDQTIPRARLINVVDSCHFVLEPNFPKHCRVLPASQSVMGCLSVHFLLNVIFNEFVKHPCFSHQVCYPSIYLVTSRHFSSLSASSFSLFVIIIIITNSCGRPLPCGHSCAATCGRCTKLTLSKTTADTQLEQPAPSHQHQQQEQPPAVAGAAGSAWAAAAAVMEGDGHDDDEGGSAARAAAVVAAAETRTHHAICRIVSHLRDQR